MGLKGILFFASIFVMALVSYPILSSNYFGRDSSVIESPLPEFLTKIFPNVLGENIYWKPSNTVIASVQKKPEITAVSAIVYDLSSDKLIYQKNPKKRLPLASLTKVMTAIVALENEPIDKIFTVDKDAAEIGENTMGLSVGERLSLEDLLYGLILHSGNDASETIARGSKFGRNNFIFLMNKKAEDLGLTDTHFTNPSGLEGDGNQYSTVHDLLVVTRYALENPIFQKIVSTVDYEIPYTYEHKYIYLYNETNLLTSYPGVKGVKTGYTDEAGLCLVTYLKHDGHRIIAVLLSAENRRQEMKDLLDYSLRSLGVTPPLHN